MAKAIVKSGYRRIGFLGTKMPLDHRARKRFEGFTEGLAKAGIEVADQEFYSGGSALAKGREMTETILRRTPDLDFLYYSNDLIGAGGLLYLLEKGVKVPEEIGLAAFNNVELLDGLPKRLATMDAGRVEIGRAAAEIIAKRAMGEVTETGQRIELTPKLQHGDTLRPPKAD
jgi:LacI family gluconate utilization system Gnt-I transcriptional repressor